MNKFERGQCQDATYEVHQNPTVGSWEVDFVNCLQTEGHTDRKWMTALAKIGYKLIINSQMTKIYYI